MKKICLLMIIAVMISGCVSELFEQNIETDKVTVTTVAVPEDSSSDDDSSDEMMPDDDSSADEPPATVPITKYYIIFDVNGGSGVMYDVTSDSTLSQNLPSCTFSAPTGMYFDHWSDTSDDSGTVYTDKILIKNLTGNVTTDSDGNENVTLRLYAIWSGRNHIIHFFGAIGDSRLESKPFRESEPVILLDLTADGYDFLGWYDADIGGNQITGWAAGERTDDVTAYARWKAHTYTVIYYANGGSGTMSKQTMTYGTEMPLSACTYLHSAYLFVGWSYHAEDTTADYTDEQIVSNLTAADGGIVELYAVWSGSGAWELGDINAVMAFSDGGMTLRILDASPDIRVVANLVQQLDYMVGLDLSYCIDLKNIGTEFQQKNNLRSIILPDSVTSIGDYAFFRCSGLTSIKIPNSVTSIGDRAFYECSGLTSITIPNSVTSIGYFAFSWCSGLTSIKIPNSVTTIGNGAFGACSGLTSITIPDSVTTIGNGAFGACSGLTSIKIPNSVTSIGNSAFKGCSGLTSITIPDSVTSIGDYAFEDCRGLTSITIPDSVTTIGGYAFKECNGLKNVTIGKGVKSIGDAAFRYYCIELTHVTLYGEPPTIYYNGNSNEDVFYDQTVINYYVPKIYIEQYYSAAGWYRLKYKITVIEE